MYEHIPEKKPGDDLYAAEVNRLAAGMGLSGASRPGSFMSGLRTSGMMGDAGMLPSFQCVVKIARAGSVSGEWIVNPRYYDFEDKTWKEDAKEWDLDANATESELSVGDYISAVFLQQRQSFIPVGGGSSATIPVRSFILRTDLDPGGVAIAQWTEFRDVCNPGECDEHSSLSSASSLSSHSVSSQSAQSSMSSLSTSSSESSGDCQICKKLCWKLGTDCKPIYFVVFDRLKEFWGYKHKTCGFARRLSGTPTLADFCIDVEGTIVNDATLWEIERLVCPTFQECDCQDFDVDPCEYGDWIPNFNTTFDTSE
jgi:hypothetical protein